MIEQIIAALTKRWGGCEVGKDEFRQVRSLTIPGTGLRVDFAEFGLDWAVMTGHNEELTERRDFTEATPEAVIAAVEAVLAEAEAGLADTVEIKI